MIPSLHPGIVSAALAALYMETPAALDIDYTTAGKLMDGEVHTRPSHATMYDSSGRLTFAPNNMATYSSRIGDTWWNRRNAITSVTMNYGVAPDGSMTATRVVGTTGWYMTQDDGASAATVVGGAYIVSCWIKAATAGQKVRITINYADASPELTLTTDWVRYSARIVAATAGSAAGFGSDISGTASDIQVWGFQVERVTYQTTPRDYIETTAAAYYGPRFEYDPVLRESKGLLVEESRSNLQTYSQDFTNAVWGKSAVTLVAGDIAPDGVTVSSKIIPGTNNEIHWVIGSGNTVATSAHSVFVKAAGYTKIGLRESNISGLYASFDLSTGTIIENSTTNGSYTITNPFIEPVGNGWYRIGYTLAASGASSIGLWVLPNSYTTGNPQLAWSGDGVSGICVFGAQFEQGAGVTSYIPTIAAQVTRAADSTSLTGANVSSWYNQSEGTFVATFESINAAATQYAMSVDDGSTNNRHVLYTYIDANTWALSQSAGAITFNSAIAAHTAKKTTALAMAYKANDFAAAKDGGNIVTDTSGAVPTGIVNMRIGHDGFGAGHLNGYIRSIRYYRSRKSNADLRGLSTKKKTWYYGGPDLPRDHTFSRASNATMYDSAGKLTFAPNNLLVYSSDFGNSAWQLENVTRTTGQSDVNGGATGVLVTPTGAVGSAAIYQTHSASGEASYIFSAYVKPVAATWCYVQVNTAATDADTQHFNLSTGAVGSKVTLAGVSNLSNATISAAANGFFRISVRVRAASNTTVVSVYLGVSTADGDRLNNTTRTAIYCAPQLERVTYENLPRTYNPTTSAAYYGPRIDYDPSTLALRGLLIEESRTNNQRYSSDLMAGSTYHDLNNAAGISTSAQTSVANATTAPDGTVTADFIAEFTNNGQHYYYGEVWGDAANKCYSVYLKAAGRTKARIMIGAGSMGGGCSADVDLAAGTISAALNQGYTPLGSGIENVGNGWYRCWVACTTTAAAHVGYVGFKDDIGNLAYVGDNTKGFYIWGVQMEIGSFPTSYIPTSSATVTRAAESASMTGTNFSSWYNQNEGTFIAEFDTQKPSTESAGVFVVNDGSPNNRMMMAGSHSGYGVVGGAEVFAFSVTPPAARVMTKQAFAYKVNDFAGVVNGGSAQTDSAGAVPTVNRLDLGFIYPGLPGSNTLNGHIKSLDYYPVRKPNVEIQFESTKKTLFYYGGPALPTGHTFSRNGHGTRIDENGKLTFAPNNMLVRSEEIQYTWVGENILLASNNALAPDGTITADKVADSASNTWHSIQQSITAEAGAYTFSIYAKASGRTKFVYRPWATTASNWIAAEFDLVAQTARTVAGTTTPHVNLNATIEDVGNGWFRCSHTFRMTSAQTLNNYIFLSNNTTIDSSGPGYVAYIGDAASGMYWWGMQVERVTYEMTPRAYNPTVLSAYYGPRFDHDPVTKKPRGILIEEARTNLLLRSQEFDNASWVNNGLTITANSQTAPDGTTTAYTVNDSIASFSYVTQSVVKSGGNTHTASIFVKKDATGRATRFAMMRLFYAGGAAKYFDVSLDTSTGETNAATSTNTPDSFGAINCGDYWRLYVVGTDNGANTSLELQFYPAIGAGAGFGAYNAATTGSSVIWGAQIEAGNHTTSYIPTAASAVTRPGDVLYVSGTALASWYTQSEGAFVTDARTSRVPDGNNYANILSGTDGVTYQLTMAFHPAGVRLAQSNNPAGVAQNNLNGGAYTVGASERFAFGYKVNDFAFSVNGGALVVDTDGAVPTSVNQLRFGADWQSAGSLNGHLKSFDHYARRPSNAALRKLSAVA